MKPEIFQGRDGLVEGIAQLLLRGETSRICIIGPGGISKTSVSLAIVESLLIMDRFPGENVVWVPSIAATPGLSSRNSLHSMVGYLETT